MNNKKERIEQLLKSYITESSSYIDTKISIDRAKAYDYYYGELPAAKKNQPSIVKKVAFSKVQQALTEIKEPFLSGRDVVNFIPYNTTDGYGACIASSVVNKILKTDNNIDVMYDQLILDGLIAKSGTIKVSWEDKEDYYEESFEGLSEQALEMLLDQDDVELIESEEVDPPFDLMALISQVPPQIFAQAYPNVQEKLKEIQEKAIDWDSLLKVASKFATEIKAIREAGITYSGVIEREVDCSTVKIKNVAPENFLIDEAATSIETSTFVAERSRVTVSELSQMGFKQSLVDEVAESSEETINDLGIVEISRNSFDSTNNSDYRVSDDESQRFVDLYECYVETALVEYEVEKAKGKRSKLYQMYYANGILLEYSEVDARPLFTWCPLPVAHKMFGQSMVETLFEQQDTATAALRGAIQYLAFSTNPRYKAIGGADKTMSLAAFQANLPGSVVNVPQGDLVPFQYPTLDQGLLQIMSVIADDADSISGVSNLSAGLNPDALRSNVAGSTVALQMDASGRRVKNYARNLATQCIKPAYAYVYELFRKNSEKDIVVQVDGKDVIVNPKSLPIRKNLDIDYSMGKNDQIEHAMSLLNTKARIEANPQLMKYHTPSQAYQLEADIMSSSGVYDVARYLSNPNGAPKEPTAVEQQQIQLQQSQQAIAKQVEDNKALDLQVRKQMLDNEARKLELDALKIQADIEMKKMELEHKVLVDQAKLVNADDELEFKQELAADAQTLNEQKLEMEALKTTAEIALESDQSRAVAFD